MDEFKRSFQRGYNAGKSDGIKEQMKQMEHKTYEDGLRDGQAMATETTREETRVQFLLTGLHQMAAMAGPDGCGALLCVARNLADQFGVSRDKLREIFEEVMSRDPPKAPRLVGLN